MIKEFQGEFRWLSNFAPVSVVYDGVKYRSVEHAYMAAKSNDKAWREFCKNTYKAGEVKKASRTISLRDDWEQVKIDVMRELLEQKYNTEPYKAMLLGQVMNTFRKVTCGMTNSGEFALKQVKAATL